MTSKPRDTLKEPKIWPLLVLYFLFLWWYKRRD